MQSIQDFLEYMETPAYKAAAEAARRAKEKAEDDYFDQLGETVERHPVGRPISRFTQLAEQPKAAIAPTPDSGKIWQAVKDVCQPKSAQP